LLHFLLIGIAVFAIYRLVTPPEPARADRVVDVTQVQVERLAGQFEAVWRRPPTETELAQLIDNFVREEIYYREALALGLDRDDTVIRRRLQQKMEFLSDTGAGTLVPSEAELRAYFTENIDRFTPAARVTFRQVFLDDEDPAAVLAKLSDGADPREFGRGSLLPPAMEASPRTAVDGTFGEGFFAAVAELEPGAWRGPIDSAFGKHLVDLLALEPAVPPAFETVRSEVEQDWRRESATALREAHFQVLRGRYEVILPSAPAQ
jgi:hypothetical protein